MKKNTKIILLFLLSLFIIGCSPLQYIKKEKPSVDYYTSLLFKLVKEEDFSIQVLDTNVYREITVDTSELRILSDLLSSVKKDNFLSTSPEGLPNKGLYKLFIIFNTDKFVIDVYGNDIITIYPWDGDFDKDYLNLNGIPTSYKLEQFCKYIFSK